MQEGAAEKNNEKMSIIAEGKDRERDEKNEGKERERQKE